MANLNNNLILSGDIGGTKTYLGLFADRDGHLELVKEATFINSNFSDHMAIIGAFVERDELGRIESASFGIACPVVSNRCKMTNLPWVIDGEEIGKRFKIKKVELINDLVSIAWGVGLLPKNDFLVLQEGVPRQGNSALIAAGTGLGEAILFWDGREHIPSGSEGGHADFAPTNELEMELLSYMMGLYGHVSFERILSGPGLENIYNFLKAKRGVKEPEYLRKRFELEGVSPVVSDEAINGEDEACKEALNLFISIYGAEAGNLALKSMAVAGVYVGGGIAPKILKAIEDKIFMESFRKKGRFEKFLSEVPVYVILNEKTGLLGAAACAVSLLPERKRIRRIDYKANLPI